MTLNKITKSEYPDVFEDLMEWSIGETYHQYRRGSNYFTRALIEFSQSNLPEHPDLWGKWESDTFIDDYEYGINDDGPSTLYRVEEKSRMVEQKYYERMA